MKVRIKFDEFRKCLMQTYSQLEKDGGVVVDAEPVEDSPEWEKDILSMCINRTSPHLNYQWEIRGQPADKFLINFIREEVLTKFAQECKGLCISDYGIAQIDATLSKWIGGKV